MRTSLLAAIVLAFPLVSVRAQQPSPRDELLRLVPDDTAICLVVQGLRERSKAVAESPFAEWAQKKYQPAIGSAPELQKFQEVEKG